METEAQVKWNHRSLPWWGWLLGALMFPSSMFLALGAARVISWTRALCYAAISYIPLATAVTIQIQLEEEPHGIRVVWQVVVAAVMIVYFVGLGWWMYRIGKGVGYWTEQARRVWRIVGVAGISLMALELLVVAAFVIFALTLGIY